MCGIAGIYESKKESVQPDLLRAMTEVLTHRGPDDEGYVLFGHEKSLKLDGACTNANLRGYSLGFGHRRLSIIDLSSAGHQPMSNEDQTVWITYNGEVYNYLEIRRELIGKGHVFRSNTDTEVVLHAYEEWDVDCLQKFIGMWAFALWDERKRRLFCARDRLGIKPFYYYWHDGRFLFASEIKAIIADRSVERIPNDPRIYDYLTHGHLDHTEETVFRDIKQLRGGCFLTLDMRTHRLAVFRYWDVEAQGPTRPCPDKVYAEKFFELFRDSVSLRLRSDVPVGTCLSGGLDSSSIVCMTNGLLGRKRHKTFSSCFEEKRFDESPFIEEVVRKTGAESYRIYPDPRRLPSDMERIIWHQEEPFGSTSIYAQWNVFSLARSHQTKVILDGQGADEILGGYHPLFGDFLADLLIQCRFSRTYREIRALHSIHPYSFWWIFLHLVAGLVKAERRNLLSRALGRRRFPWLRDVRRVQTMPPMRSKFRKSLFMNRLHHLLVATSLPALLHYEDRNSMAHSIEARIPFLDHRLVEFVFSLPLDQIMRNGVTKVVLRNAMDGILPQKVQGRMDKIGFGTPEDIWFRTELRSWIKAIIGSEKFQKRGYLNPRRAEEEFNLHCEGKKNISFIIWRWVNLELWFRMFMDPT